MNFLYSVKIFLGKLEDHKKIFQALIGMIDKKIAGLKSVTES